MTGNEEMVVCALAMSLNPRHFDSSQQPPLFSPFLQPLASNITQASIFIQNSGDIQGPDTTFVFQMETKAVALTLAPFCGDSTFTRSPVLPLLSPTCTPTNRPTTCQPLCHDKVAQSASSWSRMVCGPQEIIQLSISVVHERLVDILVSFMGIKEPLHAHWWLFPLSGVSWFGSDIPVPLGAVIVITLLFEITKSRRSAPFFSRPLNSDGVWFWGSLDSLNVFVMRPHLWLVFQSRVFFVPV